jgi:hypothetical protein
MIFANHAENRRDIFVTDDVKGFVKDGRREQLENQFSTKIQTSSEFRGWLRNQS